MSFGYILFFYLWDYKESELDYDKFGVIFIYLQSK